MKKKRAQRRSQNLPLHFTPSLVLLNFSWGTERGSRKTEATKTTQSKMTEMKALKKALCLLRNKLGVVGIFYKKINKFFTLI